MPGIKESPLQITPSQSKMKTSVLSKTSFAGSESFNTLAFKAVRVDVNARGATLGLNAEAEATNVGKTNLPNFIINLGGEKV
mmetsp:Transcript_146/g.193  ORF Transcript_146/g.193 Transcript_146/m.193 type:complete len:82 (+) Transcript_146:2306-2551(+)